MKNPLRNPLLAVATLLVAAGTVAVASAPEWEVELLPRDASWVFTWPQAINERGWVAGYAGDFADLRPVLWRDGGYIDLLEEFEGAEDYVQGQALAVNDHGWIGGAVIRTTPAEAVLWDGKHGKAHIVHPDASDVPDYEFTDSLIWGLNDRTEAAGSLRNFPGDVYESERAYVWGRYGKPGTLLPIPDGYGASEALQINDHGVVAGNVWDEPFDYNLEACAWIPGCHGEYELVHVHPMLAAAYPEITRSIAWCVDDRGRVYGIGQTSSLETLWTFVWDERDGLRFLDTDGSVGQVWGAASKRVLAGYRGDLFTGDLTALAWIRETPYDLPHLPDHAGMTANDANSRGDLVGSANLAGNTYWWQGSEAWIAHRVRGHCDD